MKDIKNDFADNKCIKEAADLFGSKRNEENLFNLFNVLIDRMLVNAEAPLLWLM